MKIMELMKKKRYRLFVSLTVAMVVTVMSSAGVSGNETETLRASAQAPVCLAWWGTLYPEFCFSGTDRGKTADAPERKISFWLAKHFDW